MIARRAAAGLALVALCAAQTFAQPNAAAPRTVALVPLATLGNEATSASSKKVTADLEAALGAVAGVKIVGTAAVADAIKKAKRAQLKACDGEAGCLAEVGKLVGANLVVYGEIGGLGEVQVVYLEAIDVSTGKEARSTTLSLGSADDGGGARGAAVRLLAPERYLGKLAITVDIAGATVFVDGKRLGKSPLAAVELPVGSHAVRVTHPEYRDFVRFVDVPYDAAAPVKVDLQQFPIVERDLASKAGQATLREHLRFVPGGRPPWYRHWYVLAGFGAVLAVGAGTAAALSAGGPSADHTRTVHPPP
ncbi:MAG: PEGA domain-containing protein [Deltaproteobacteria bacterium]|nr:PEGA domain-containing protein [Deltaproteobacteria bacterium]